MSRRRAAGLIVVLAVAAAAAGATAHATAAAPARAGTHASDLDSTYSCLVRPQHYVDIDTSVVLPPQNNEPQPAQMYLSTKKKTITRDGTQFNVPQVTWRSEKDSLGVDLSACRRSSRHAALTPKGLPRPGETVTQSFIGHFHERCSTAKRVLVHFRITLKARTPQSALVAIRNDDARSRAIAFFQWKPRTITGYLGNSCVSTG